jgi:hypothetical protein
LTLLDLFKWAFSRKRKWLEPNKIVSRYRFRGKWSFSFLLLGNLVKWLVDFTVKVNFPNFFAILRIWINSLSLFQFSPFVKLKCWKKNSLLFQAKSFFGLGTSATNTSSRRRAGSLTTPPRSTTSTPTTTERRKTENHFKSRVLQ